ncbi:MAG TPA: SRPBCC family protein [Vicinamibacteria bacterium]|nr:SRPBCC family protein [Vicinamibacteria bacterium]
MIDPSEHRSIELSRASTIPSSWYLDPAFLSLERERVFFRTWQWVGRAADVSRPGDYFTHELLGEPLLISRDEAGTLRGFYNVCRHRAGPVAARCGNRKQFQCGYHGWTYGLDGRLRRAPEMEGVNELDLSSTRLEPVAVGDWGPFVFANLDPAASPLPVHLAEIGAEIVLAGFPLGAMPMVERREYEIDCNWKVYVDNYLEGYHIPVVHPGLFREIDYARYRVEPHGSFSKQLAPLRPGREDRTYPRTGELDEALYYWIFPNLMLNVYPGNMQVNVVLPLSESRTLTVFEWYGKGDIEQAIAFSEQIQREDMRICAAVQRGLASRSYDRGRLSVAREAGVHHFHGLLHERLVRVASEDG